MSSMLKKKKKKNFNWEFLGPIWEKYIPFAIGKGAV